MFDSISVDPIGCMSVAVLWVTQVGFEIKGNKENEYSRFVELLTEMS